MVDMKKNVTFVNIISLTVGWVLGIILALFLTGCFVLATPTRITEDEMVRGYTPYFLQLDGYEHCYDVEFEGKDYKYMQKK